jgi:hypothetical protein
VRGDPADVFAGNRTLPFVGVMSPAIVLSNVDLPAPLAPITASVSPSATSTDSSCKAWKSP